MRPPDRPPDRTTDISLYGPAIRAILFPSGLCTVMIRAKRRFSPHVQGTQGLVVN